MTKVVIHIFHGDDDSISYGSRLSERIRQIAADKQAEVEVFCFGPAQARLTGGPGDEARAVHNRRLDDLIAAGVPVGACVNAAKADGTDEELRKRGFTLEVARDAFLRFALEGATVITF
ncbi:hypothetical protein SAMN05421869_11772 [Nonomuraea jiangxiensis]|uniref:Uncharacterized protein n=2 Tax=Nonomuraea jiangxiensis TaxID=633440 RepID=A0A1G9DBE1_9ACTN|nr:hypothetical protein SAMN05421869_11772 [Nonomuraea jiangxiensis]